MLFEDILLLLGLGASIFLIGIPFYKLVRAVIPERRDPVKEAKIRLETAKADAEAAKLNKEAEKVYEGLYNEALEDETTTENRRRV
jgi:hypothetical protein